MKTVNIKGKPYVEVNERIKHFRTNYKDWALESEIVSLENGVCVIKATVKNPEGITKATGYAYEKENSTFINKTSYIENCETSAWGRALGNLGIGVDTSIASVEEVINAIMNQEEKTVSKRKQQEKKPIPDSDKEFYDVVSSIDNIDDVKGYYEQTRENVSDRPAYHKFVCARIVELKQGKENK